MKSILFAILATTFTSSAFAAINMEQAFENVTVETPACFVRQYDAAHLASYPKQTVRQIKIKLYQWVYGEDKSTQASIGIQVKRKGEDKTWTNNITCMNNSENGDVICPVECDGGSVEIQQRKQGMLVLKNNGVTLYGGCGDDVEAKEQIFLEGKKGGDDVFDIPQVDVKECADVTNEAH